MSTTLKRFVSDCETFASRLPIAPSVYRRCYERIVRREVELASLNADDHVLNVGCGSIPATAVTLVRLTGAEVTCLDHDVSAVSNARRFVYGRGLESDITVLEADGREFRFGEFSSGIVALHTIGKSTVVENFFADANRGDRLVVRYPRPNLVDQYGHPGGTHRPDRSVSQFGLGLDRSALFTV
jgi:hypothetical protein